MANITDYVKQYLQTIKSKERGITMKVTVVYWHYRKVWRRTRDNNEGLTVLYRMGE